MTPRERIQQVLNGNRPDRAPVSVWRHHPRYEVTTEGLVNITVQFQQTYGWDIVKINPRAEYHAEAWGNRYALYLDDHRRPTLLEHRVREPRDFERLEELDPEEGVLGEHLRAVREIRHRLGPDVPIVMTLFTPLSVAAELAGIRRANPGQICEHAASLRAGLEVITRTFAEFARKVIEAGADGLFYATTRLGTRQYLTDSQFLSFSQPYDLRILDAVRDAPLNILHVCGPQCMLDLTRDYPVLAYSWDMADPSNPGPEVVTEGWGRVAIGGIDQKKISSPDGLAETLAQVKRWWQTLNGRRFIVAGGCVLPTDAPPETLARIREAANEMR